MRQRSYWLFELVAWPAAVWCAAEAAIRIGTGATEGLAATVMLGACAAGTIVTARTRQAMIAPRPVRVSRD